MDGDPDHAVLAQAHLQATEAAGVARRVGTERVQHADDHVGCGARLGLVESDREAIRVIPGIDDNRARLRIDLDAHSYTQSLWETGIGIMRALSDQCPTRQAPDRVPHSTLAVVEPLLDEGTPDVDAVLRA